jgi:predicted nuclease of predicted toxin-antitoxin system
MRIIANENVMATVVGELRSRGHDVLSVKETIPKAADDAVLARAQSEQRLVITHDKDFGELAFRYGLPAECGVLLIRLSGGRTTSRCRSGSQSNRKSRRLDGPLQRRQPWPCPHAAALHERRSAKTKVGLVAAVEAAFSQSYHN